MSGEPLLLLPGLVCDARLFEAQIEYLANRCQLFVPSLADDDSIEMMAVRVLGQAPPRFALCGYSLGSSVALEIMRIASGRVTRLAILSGHGRADDEPRRARRQQLIEEVLAGGYDEVCVRLLRGLLSAYWRDNHYTFHAILHMMRELGPEVFVRQTRALMRRRSATSVLASIQCPTLVVSGALDPITPLALQAELAIATRARHVICRQAAHVVPIEAHWAVKYALAEWLDW